MAKTNPTHRIEEFNIAFIFLKFFSTDNSAENFIRLPVNPKLPIVAKDVTERINDQSPNFSIPIVEIIYLYKKKALIETTTI
jgi:hypothetical protein